MQPHPTQPTVLITGASAGIGASFAVFLAARGYHVLLTARRAERLAAIQKTIQRNGGDASFFPADISNQTERLALVRWAKLEAGQVDVLINNAGFGWYGYYQDMPWRLASDMADVNIRSVIHLTHLFLKEMAARKNGHIINIGSIAGSLPNQGIALYAASKAFLDAFTAALYRENVSSGVSVSVMRLGPVKTEFYQRAKTAENGRAIPLERNAIPVGRVNRALWRLLRRPRRTVFVPAWLRFTPIVEPLLGWLIDLLGPLLLKKSPKE